jgi:hypothetical protein
MKVRIQENSLRLRLTQIEVRQLHDHSRVESSIEFAPGCSLAYSLEASVDTPHVAAEFDGRGIRVTLPQEVMKSWTRSDCVSIDAPSTTGPQLLIEKDFQCLHKPAEANPGAYPHPLARLEN